MCVRQAGWTEGWANLLLEPLRCPTFNDHRSGSVERSGADVNGLQLGIVYFVTQATELLFILNLETE